MNYTRIQSRVWGTYALLGASMLFALTICLYTVLMFKTVSFTAYKQHMHTSMSESTARLGDLEAQYMTLKNNITTETESKLGFREVAIKSYVSRPSQALSLGSNR